MTVFGLLPYVLACPQCEAALGGGSRTLLDYTLAGGAAVVVGLTIAYALKCLMRPGESGPAHVKVTVLNDAFVDQSEERQ
jgi:hypothetical protein